MILLLHFFDNYSQRKRYYCVKSAIGILSFNQNCYPIFGRVSQIFKTKLLVQTLISQPNMDQIERFMDQSLHWLIVDRKIPTFKIGDLVFVLHFIKQQVFFDSPGIVSTSYCLTKISIRARGSISRVFCLSFPVPFLYMARTKACFRVTLHQTASPFLTYPLLFHRPLCSYCTTGPNSAF